MLDVARTLVELGEVQTNADANSVFCPLSICFVTSQNFIATTTSTCADT